MKYKLEIIVFISGAVVMMLELIGSRILAPYLGTSIFVWTSLIGIILGSLSLGYYLGGKLADKGASYKNFALILFFAAILTGLTTFSKDTVLNFLQENFKDIRLNAVLATIILFAPASIFLGMISPYAVRLKIKTLEKSGRTVGNLYAISTVGSIVGTFLTGFVLLSYFGNTKLLLILAIALGLLSLLAYTEKFSKIRTFIIIFLASYFAAIYNTNTSYGKPETIDLDTLYNHVLIYEDIDKSTGKPVLRLNLNGSNSSAMFLDSDELVFGYTKYYNLAQHFKPDLKSALMIGGGAYSYPKEFLKKFPNATMDVIEIDSKLTELAKKYFRLKESLRLKFFHEDGRTFINKTKNKYDVIFGDAFQAFYAIPHQLTTIEAVQKMYDILNEDGAILVNVISTLEGEKSKFLAAEYKTFKAVFPQVYLFPVQYPKSGDTVQNILLVALKSPVEPDFVSLDPELNEYLKHQWEPDISKTVPADTATNPPILTDDFAPVDQYIMELL